MSTRIMIGDVRERLAELPDESVHCVVTSPPYFGLRAYLPDGHANKHMEIWLEETPAACPAYSPDAPRAALCSIPFGGAGTTGLVADRHGRDAILIELNPEYAAIAERRINIDAGMFSKVAAD
jgi:DNA modification methylase